MSTFDRFQALCLELAPTAGVVGIGATLLYALYRRLLPKPLPGIPYNRESAKRLMGDIPDVAAFVNAGGYRDDWWTYQPQKHKSPIVQFFFGPGTAPIILVADSREAHDLLLRRGKDFIRGDIVASVWAGVIPGHFIGMEDHDPHFKEAKALAKDLMTPRFLQDVSAPASYEMAVSLIRLWKLKADAAGGAPFNADDDLNHLTFDIMAAAAFGVPPSEGSLSRYLESLEATGISPVTGGECVDFPKIEMPELFDALLVSETTAGDALWAVFPRMFHFFNKLFGPKVRWSERVRHTAIRSYVKQAIERRAQDPEKFKPTSALEHMVSRLVETSGPDASFENERLRDGIWGYMIGGQESTHASLGFAAKRFGVHQEAQKRLREALQKAHGDAYSEGRQPTAREISRVQVPYLDAFIQEVLRMDPPATASPRMTACDMVILGHVIPKGTMVVLAFDGPTINSPGTKVAEERRSESSRKAGGLSDWADSDYPCDEFLPERWIKGNGVDGVYDAAAGPYLTFGSGSRGCWGKRLAYLELRLIVTLMVWNFYFDELPESCRNWDLEGKIFAKPREAPVKIRPIY